MNPTTRTRSLLVVTSAVAAFALVASGAALPFPRDLRPDRLEAWITEVGPATATFTALRALGLALLAWVVVTAAAGLVARRLRWTTVTRGLDHITLPLVRRFAGAVASATLVASSVAGAASAGATPSTTSSTSSTSTPAGVVAMHDLGPPPPAPTSTAAPPTTAGPLGTPVTMRSLEPVAPTPAPPPPRSSDVPSTWTIRAGDTLWHVAEQAASVRTGEPAGPAATLAELDRIVALNADRLVVPGNPDLVLPGQEFVLP